MPLLLSTQVSATLIPIFILYYRDKNKKDYPQGNNKANYNQWITIGRRILLWVDQTNIY